jgi:hypothetical protein
VLGEEAAQRAAAAAAAKPGPQAADALRQEFIVSKYVRRLYGPLPHMLPGGSPQSALWDAAENGDVRCAQCHMQKMHHRVDRPGPLVPVMLKAEGRRISSHPGRNTGLHWLQPPV